MKESDTHIDFGITQGLRAGRQSMSLDRFGSVSSATTGPLPAIEPLLDCAGAGSGGFPPSVKTVRGFRPKCFADHFFAFFIPRFAGFDVLLREKQSLAEFVTPGL